MMMNAANEILKKEYGLKMKKMDSSIKQSEVNNMTFSPYLDGKEYLIIV